MKSQSHNSNPNGSDFTEQFTIPVPNFICPYKKEQSFNANFCNWQNAVMSKISHNYFHSKCDFNPIRNNGVKPYSRV